jgi:hypothetical protein
MHREQLQISVVLVVVAILASAGVTSAADQWVGSWKLNLAKSKYNLPDAVPKNQTLKQEASPDGMKAVVDGVDAQGKPMHWEYSAKYDGKDYPWTGNPNADMVVLKRVDDRSYEATWKLKGKTLMTSKSTVLPDGKTRTIIQTGKDAQGRDVNFTLVFDKQ